MPSKQKDLNDLIDDRIESSLLNRDAVSASRITQEALDYWNPDTPEGAEFWAAYGIEMARGVAHDKVLKAIARRRRGVVPMIPTQAASAAEKRLARAPRTWGDYLEYNGVEHKRYMTMVRGDLLAAAQIRRARGEHEIHLASLHELVAGRLPDETTKVEDVLSEKDIETLSSGIQVRYGITWMDLLGEHLSLKGSVATAAD